MQKLENVHNFIKCTLNMKFILPCPQNCTEKFVTLDKTAPRRAQRVAQ